MPGPIKSFKHKGIDIAVWEVRNGGYSFSLQKRYKDKISQEWKESKYWFPDDVRALRSLITEACEWLDSVGENKPAAPKFETLKSNGVAEIPLEDDDIPF